VRWVWECAPARSNKEWRVNMHASLNWPLQLELIRLQCSKSSRVSIRLGFQHASCHLQNGADKEFGGRGMGLDTWGFSEGGISSSEDRLQVLHIQLYAASIHALHTILRSTFSR